MLKFNNDNIFTGYLKQLLTSFNLPKYRIYTIEQQKYHDWAVAQHNPNIPLEKDVLESIIPNTALYPGFPNHLRIALYLKDNKVQYYTKNNDGTKSWHNSAFHYHENKKELNQTKNFIIKNNIYDTYTHEYLGDFLRFIRDYYDINLMPLYNCFSAKLCSNIKLEIKTESDQIATFDSSDTNFKIYMLPVKLFKEYTIAIDSDTPIEMCCGFFGPYLDNRPKISKISEFTYRRINTCMFSSPFIYDSLLQTNLDKTQVAHMELAQNEPDLKLFLKIPTSNKSSITILEGNYSGYNNSFFNNNLDIVYNPTGNKQFVKINNHYITNYAKTDFNNQIKLPNITERTLNPITNLQLLSINTGVSYPFSDTLIEYLSGNVITPQDEITDNIKRTQYVMNLNNNHFPVFGAWDNSIKNVIYDYMSKLQNKQGTDIDVLGYIDKNAEKYYAAKIYENGKAKTCTISNVDIYKDPYLDDNWRN